MPARRQRGDAPKARARGDLFAHRLVNPVMRASYHRCAGGKRDGRSIFQAADFTLRTPLRLPTNSVNGPNLVQ
jgi:hypothetical protein